MHSPKAASRQVLVGGMEIVVDVNEPVLRAINRIVEMAQVGLFHILRGLSEVVAARPIADEVERAGSPAGKHDCR
jgi:hypothetical protein